MSRADPRGWRTPDAEHARRVRNALAVLVPPPGDRSAASERDRREALGACVVALVELTAATQVLAIHLRLSGELDVSGLATSRYRVHVASAAMVRHQAAVLRALEPCPGPDGWVDAVVGAAEAALARWSALPESRIEALGRLVAGALAEAVVTPASSGPSVARSAGQALALHVLTADPPVRTGTPERSPGVVPPAP